MTRLVSTLAWTPPLAIPAMLLAICAISDINLDAALPWTIGSKVWRLGNLIDMATLVAAMWEMTRAAQIDNKGLVAAVVSMIIPRIVVGIILFLVPALLTDPHVVNLLAATLGAPGLAGLLRVSVARRDISLAR